jgi:basic membrane protein A
VTQKVTETVTQTAAGPGATVTVTETAAGPGAGEVIPERQAMKIFMGDTLPNDDFSWGQSTYEGLVMATEKHDMEYEFKDLVTYPELESVVLEAAETPEFGIVWGSGIEWTVPSVKICHRYPEKTFIATCVPTADLPYSPDNFASMYFAPNTIGYIVGYLAAKMSETKKIAATTGTELACGNNYANGYKLGAWAADKEVRATYAEVGYWGDPAKEKELTYMLADDGYDVIFGCWLGMGHTEACRERNVWDIGNYAKVSAAPDIAIADAIENHGEAIDMIMHDWLRGLDTGKAYRVGAYAVFNEDLIPSNILTDAKGVMNSITLGEISVPKIVNRTPASWPYEPASIDDLRFEDPLGAAYLPQDILDYLKERYAPAL